MLVQKLQGRCKIMRGLSLKSNSNKHNTIFILNLSLGIILLAGVLLGAWIVKAYGANEKSYFTYFIEMFLQIHKKNQFFAILSYSFLSSLVIHITTLLFAYCCVGAPFIIAMPFIKGVFIGSLSAYLYVEMGLKGAFVNIMLLWLPQVLQGTLLIFFASIALDTSASLFATSFLNKKQGTHTKFNRLIRVFIFTCLLLLICACLESALAELFAPALL